MTDEWKVRHGMWRTKINTVWLNMMRRCYNSKNKYYKDYGGRGVTVCPRWHDFFCFMKTLETCQKECSWTELITMEITNQPM